MICLITDFFWFQQDGLFAGHQKLLFTGQGNLRKSQERRNAGQEGLGRHFFSPVFLQVSLPRKQQLNKRPVCATFLIFMGARFGGTSEFDETIGRMPE